MLPILRPAFTNLVRNYRSHPAILSVPSFLFYHDTLECEAPISEQSHLVDWDGWRGKGWPVLYHANHSRDEIEREGGGWYNSGEADIACTYAKQLVDSGRVMEQEICIMSPFKAQVRLLRRKMRSAQFGRLRDINIGPTEAFQGLERGVVILCTTRSKPRFVEKDIERDWGIVGMPNKMNVALTRAKYGLIIIGKRDVLESDPNWETVLAFCDRNGLVTDQEDKDQDQTDETSTSRQKAEAAAKSFAITRLEKQLLDDTHEGAREAKVLRGVVHSDEMWANSQGYDRLYTGDAYGGEMSS